ncbi:30S ribosomal protein S4 [Candidatus Parcubacteria bacterium]|nr:30S ribosomal protein S4 [Candidatus Parcubacteria bacterium]
MSRISCKICRRLGESLCGRVKCAYRKKPYPPGKLDSEKKHKSVRSEYGLQMMEKQKVRHSYGISETQFSNYVKKVRDKKGPNPVSELYELLEQRLDNVVYRLNLAPSRAFARQLVSHGHITVNGTKVTVPSYSVRVGDIVAVRAGSKKIAPFKELAEKLEASQVPAWLTVEPKEARAKVAGKPQGADLVAASLLSVLEFYSR